MSSGPESKIRSLSACSVRWVLPHSCSCAPSALPALPQGPQRWPAAGADASLRFNTVLEGLDYSPGLGPRQVSLVSVLVGLPDDGLTSRWQGTWRSCA